VVEARGDVGDDEVRVRISGCQGGAALARLEGARGKATVRQRAMGGAGGGWAAGDGRGGGERRRGESESKTVSPDMWRAGGGGHVLREHAIGHGLGRSISFVATCECN
jgi:hypothetical protein